MEKSKVMLPTALEVMDRLSITMDEVDHEHQRLRITHPQVLEYKLFACQVEALLVIAQSLGIIAEREEE